jgi:iron(III) transport system permease protein
VLASIYLLVVLGLPLALPFIDVLSTGDVSGFSIFGTLAFNTLVLVAGTIAVALPVGTAAALLLYRTDLPGRGIIRFLTILTLFIPLPVLTTAWQLALGSGGMFGFFVPQRDLPWAEGFAPAIWIHAQAAIPWVVLIVGQALRWVEPELEEDALLAGGFWSMLWHVTLPRCRGALVSAAAWVALQVSTELAVSSVMMVDTFAEVVFAEFSGGGSGAQARAVMATLPVVLVTATALYFALNYLGRLVPSLDALSARPRVFALGTARWPLLLLMLAGIGVLAGVPLEALVRQSGTVGPDAEWSATAMLERLEKPLHGNRVGPEGLDGDAMRTIVSLLQSLLSGVLAAATALVICCLAVDAPGFRRGVFALLALVWALPGPIAGVGLKDTILLVVSWVPLPPLQHALYYAPSPLPILWAHQVRFLPLAVAVLWPVVRLVPRDLRDAVRLDGAGPVTQWWSLHIPLLGRSLAAVAIVVAALAMGEVGAIAMRVETPNWWTFSSELFRRLHYGPEQDVAAWCLFMILMVGAGGGFMAAGLKLLPLLRAATPQVRLSEHSGQPLR